MNEIILKICEHYNTVIMSIYELEQEKVITQEQRLRVSEKLVDALSELKKIIISNENASEDKSS
jgi:hypothetical protein